LHRNDSEMDQSSFKNELLSKLDTISQVSGGGQEQRHVQHYYGQSPRHEQAMQMQQVRHRQQHQQQQLNHQPPLNQQYANYMIQHQSQNVLQMSETQPQAVSNGVENEDVRAKMGDQRVGSGGVYHDDQLSTRQEMLRQQQQRLLLLRHSYKCCDGDDCTVSRHCKAAKLLWEHISQCEDDTCNMSHCLTSRVILYHYHNCKDSMCVLCTPLRAPAASSPYPSSRSASLSSNSQYNGDAEGDENAYPKTNEMHHYEHRNSLDDFPTDDEVHDRESTEYGGNDMVASGSSSANNNMGLSTYPYQQPVHDEQPQGHQPYPQHGDSHRLDGRVNSGDQSMFNSAAATISDPSEEVANAQEYFGDHDQRSPNHHHHPHPHFNSISDASLKGSGVANNRSYYHNAPISSTTNRPGDGEEGNDVANDISLSNPSSQVNVPALPDSTLL
jgi:hypothetical protein